MNSPLGLQCTVFFGETRRFPGPKAVATLPVNSLPLVAKEKAERIVIERIVIDGVSRCGGWARSFATRPVDVL